MKINISNEREINKEEYAMNINISERLEI